MAKGKNKVEGRDSKGKFVKGIKHLPRVPKAEKINPIKDYLIQKLEKDIPPELVLRIAENLCSKDTGTFLNTLKLVLSLLPTPPREAPTSPVVDQLISRYMVDVADIEVMEDKSEFGSETKDENE